LGGVLGGGGGGGGGGGALSGVVSFLIYLQLPFHSPPQRDRVTGGPKILLADCFPEP